MNSKILIFGAGSIGERHIKNLLDLGFNKITIYRQRNLPLRNVDANDLEIITDLDNIEKGQFQFAVICTPTSMHVEQTLFCIEKNIPVLVEKPLSHSLEGLNILKSAVIQYGTFLHVGYMMRYHPLLKRIKSGLEKNEWGNCIYIRTYWGEYLPNWHPWEDYRESYAAKRSLGGGAALTLSHDLDVVNWLVGSEVSNFNTMYSHASSLELDVESAADIQIEYSNGIQAHVHLNFFQKFPKREYQIECEEASLLFDFFDNSLTIQYPNNKEKKVVDSFDRNDLFLDQTKAVFKLINSERHKEYALNQIEESSCIIKLCTYEK
ncbi:Gfo/Idh/MocA family protein [Lutimonas zeaxanthinifaciens]|uniref:Gfo/Idh/MocA family protein n=1 Tax=Lutimonas zeaxanthinifaciens TaxID=3060215 RepID=UPI00265CC14C|nr:Gfo/Idh/MocA family oxidoreductase [Lutimonas sp. YSD2104]WKK67352.1 Gfo/Idh/MocA family oxidoreductase [Lutimonas sp. YSD2104]